MLTKYKNVGPKKDVKSPLKNVFHVCGVFKIFFKEAAPNCDILSCVVSFSGRIILNHIENKKGSRGVRGHAPRENLHTVVAILVLFEKNLGKFCFNFLPLNLSVLPHMIHFFRTFSITGMRAWGVRFIVIEKVHGSKLWKNCIHQKQV